MHIPTPLNQPPIRYDAERRRLWILGQRCHHGAVGALIATTAAGLLAASAAKASATTRALALAGLGGVLMLHDRHDHTIWFERGHGSQR